MPSTTGIELGPNSCVLLSAGPAPGGGIDVAAVHVIGPGEWPAPGISLADTLRAVRRRAGLPRQARVVVWGLPDRPGPDDAIGRAAAGPVIAAGFRVESVLTPPQALALLAATRPRVDADAGIAWLALNMHGAAIAIVRGAELLFARSFRWTYDARPMAHKAQLLQRYSLVAHLAPELRRGLDAVRASHGIVVEAAVTCGDLPELRSLTMPLIEELDLEVETLDSLDGLKAVGKARGGRFAEVAPVIRLACAAAASGQQTAEPRAVHLLRVSAGAAVVLALVGAAAVYRNRALEAPHSAEPARQGAPHPTPAPAASATAPTGTLPPVANPQTPAPAIMPPGTAARRGPEQPQRGAADTRGTAAAAGPARPPAPPVRQPEPTPPSTEETKSSPGAVKPLARAGTEAAAPVPRTAIDPMWLPRKGTAAGTPAPIALREPLPKIDSILMDQDRRLAVIDGRPVAVGATVGSRVVLQIEQDAVVFREPSGLAVRVELRPRAVR